MIFKRGESQENHSQVYRKDDPQPHIEASKSVKASRESGAVPGTAIVSNGTNSGPLADDLIRRVLKAMEDWAKANGLSSLPSHVVFEQALSILNAIDRSFPSSSSD